MNDADLKRRRLLAAGAGAILAPSVALHKAFAQGSRTLTDAAGRTVTLPARVERIYAAGPPASILVFAVAPDKLLGWTTAFREGERAFVPKKYLDLPTLGRLTGRGNTANIEALLNFRPDVVIDYGTVNPTYISLADRVQEQTRVPYLLLDGAFDRIPAAFEMIGTLAGAADRAALLARYARETLDAVAQRVGRVPAEKRPRVYYARGPNGLNTGLEGSINTEIIERAGARNVAAELGRGGLVQVSMEQVLRWDPEVIVTIDRNFFDEARVSPVWRGVAAVRAGRIYLAPNVPFGWIDFPPAANRLIGLRWLARVLYPALFPEDLRPMVREFYTLFYHQTPSEEQITALLSGAELRRR